MARPSWLPLLDLRPVTRNPDRSETRISVMIEYKPVLWIHAGMLTRFDLKPSEQWFGAHFAERVTDREHDGAYVFRLEVVGTYVHLIHYGGIELRARVASGNEDAERFRVPKAPVDLTSFDWCSTCRGKKRHRMGPFTPEPHRELWKRLRGAELVIEISPVIPEDDND